MPHRRSTETWFETQCPKTPLQKKNFWKCARGGSSVSLTSEFTKPSKSTRDLYPLIFQRSIPGTLNRVSRILKHGTLTKRGASYATLHETWTLFSRIRLPSDATWGPASPASRRRQRGRSVVDVSFPVKMRSVASSLDPFDNGDYPACLSFTELILDKDSIYHQNWTLGVRTRAPHAKTRMHTMADTSTLATAETRHVRFEKKGKRNSGWNIQHFSCRKNLL